MRPCFALLLIPALACAAALQTDIEFGRAANVSLKLDASIPDGPGPFPAAILVHGGGWRNGDKAMNMRPVFQPLSDAGFAWFSVNYRMWPDHPYPAAVDDLVAAINFVRNHAKEYKVDPRRIAISGESAGGHLVALVGARYGRKLGLAAVVPVYPPSDMEALAFGEDKTESASRAVLGFLGVTTPGPAAAKVFRDSSPLTWVTRDMPPFLIIHGTADKTVPYAQGMKLKAKMDKVGAECELYTVEGAPHGWLQWEKDPAMTRYKAFMIDWLKRKMR